MVNYEQAACKGLPDELMFPTQGEITTVEGAKLVCASCVIVSECLEDNLMMAYGIVGGTSERERRAIRRQRKLHLPEQADDDQDDNDEDK